MRDLSKGGATATMTMAMTAWQLRWGWRPMPTQQRRRMVPVVCSIAIQNAQNKERAKLKKLFEEAYERCRTSPTEGVTFTLEQFTDALDKYDFNADVGTKARSQLLHAFTCFVFLNLVYTVLQLLINWLCMKKT